MAELSDRLHKKMNEQIQEEIFSAYLYYSMSAWFETKNLPGFGHWMRCQAMEEMMHAHRFYNHMHERRRAVELLEIKKPEYKWGSPLEIYQAAFEHELHITGKIHDLVKIANEENDYTAEVGLLQWFVNEQIEEEESTDAVVQKLNMIGEDKTGLYQLDKELGMRVVVVPPLFKW
ncbi:MAG: ferritin [bacterium]|nr:ferritin [bacterium]